MHAASRHGTPSLTSLPKDVLNILLEHPLVRLLTLKSNDARVGGIKCKCIDP